MADVVQWTLWGFGKNWHVKFQGRQFWIICETGGAFEEVVVLIVERERRGQDSGGGGGDVDYRSMCIQLPGNLIGSI
jgi:hypothetical protein